MEFITDYRIDFHESFSEEFMEAKMKEAIKFETCCDIRKTFYDGKHVFTCETKGSDCFTCQFSRNNTVGGFSMCGKMPKHKKNCEREGQQALYIKVTDEWMQTMMLLKLRREYLEDFIEENELLGLSPKIILLAYSRKRHNLDIPFYQSYLTQRGLIQKVKKKWANLMDSIRKAKTTQPMTTKQLSVIVEGRPRVDVLSYFPDDNLATPFNSIFYPSSLLNDQDLTDKENILFDFRFDRVMQKPPEIVPLRENQGDTTCSAFGSLPVCLLNSSLEKESLKEITFR